MEDNNRPLVTIVTVTFNLIKSGREKYFRQCLASVHNQTYENIEHIIIDGASNDGTVALIEEYAKKGWVKYISEPDSGIYEAMNKGIKLARGKYIAFLNSDDFYHVKDAVKLSVMALEKNNADFSYAKFLMIDEEKNKKEVTEWGIEKFLYMMPFGHPTMFTKTEIIKKEDGFDQKFKVAADYDLVIRLILSDYKGIFLDKSIVSYRYGGVCCKVDYSDEIAQIYIKNYSCFFSFINSNQAKKIMYDLVIPDGFTVSFREYAKKKKIKNISIDKVIGSLINDRLECEDKNEKDDLNPIEGIPVFLSSDNNYAPFVATTIASIMDHTKSFVNFYILDGGITIENVRRIKELRKEFPSFSIEFIEIDVKKEFKNFPVRVHFSIDMYTRFLIPKLKPELKKVIYSDVDVIFNGDIKELLNERLDGYSLGAVPYNFGYLNPIKYGECSAKRFNERLSISAEHKYFESGLLLIDVNLWKKNNITEKLINKVKNNSNEIILTPDQDVLNIVFENNYKELDNKYIVVPHRKNVMRTDIITRKSIKKPFIIHYAGPNKPWNNPKMDMADLFWKYARMTSFYEELIFNFSNLRIPEKKDNNIKNLIDKVYFAIFSPRRFVKKYWYKFLNSRFRQPARKVWYFIRGKKIN